MMFAVHKPTSFCFFFFPPDGWTGRRFFLDNRPVKAKKKLKFLSKHLASFPPKFGNLLILFSSVVFSKGD